MMEKGNDVITIDKSFFENVSNVLDKARKNAKTAVNLSMVYAYYEIGKIIVEEEQRGKKRAAYGTQLVNELSAYLTRMYGKGFSVGNLKNIRQFYKLRFFILWQWTKKIRQAIKTNRLYLWNCRKI